MSLKKVEEVKADKGFRIFDLVIYGVVAVLIAVVFIAVFLTRDNDPFDGVRVYVRNECVYEYEFGEGGKVLKDTVEEVVEDGKVTVTVNIAGDGHNVFEIDLEKRSVSMVKADCSISPDCVYMPAITDNNKFISCEPHQLMILPLNYNRDNPDIKI